MKLLGQRLKTSSLLTAVSPWRSLEGSILVLVLRALTPTRQNEEAQMKRTCYGLPYRGRTLSLEDSHLL